MDKSLSRKNVYTVRLFRIDVDKSADFVIKNFLRFTPDRRPVFTCFETQKPSIKCMQVKIEVEALPELYAKDILSVELFV